MSNKSFHILLVEDDPGDTELTRLGLTQAENGTTMSVVTRGKEALDYLQKEEPYENTCVPDLILLDLNLPGLSGAEVLQIIKQDPALRSIPVVILTTSNNESDILEAYALGASGYVKKHGDLQRFLGAIAQIEQYWRFVVELPAQE